MAWKDIIMWSRGPGITHENEAMIHVVEGHIHRLSGGDECRQVGGLPVGIICRIKNKAGLWMGTLVQASHT